MSCLLAESEGLGSLRSPASLLRKLSYCRLLLTRLRLAKDCKGSNPLLSYQQKNKGYSKRYTLYSWRRVRDSAHFVRPRVCSANYPIIDFFWQDFVLQKIVRVRIPCCLINKKIKGIANAIPFILGGEWGIRTLGPVRDYLISSQVVKTELGGIWRKIKPQKRTPKTAMFKGFSSLLYQKN